MPVKLPIVVDNVQWYHKLIALPIQVLTRLNIGPFGGDPSISAVIEAILADRQGYPLGIALNKTEQFLVKKTVDQDASGLIEYRELNYQVQEVFLQHWGEQKLGVIWIGGGVFTLNHPLLAHRKPSDWHVWTDAHPKVIQSGEVIFRDLQAQGRDAGLLYDLILPQQVDKLNRIINFLASHNIEHLLIQGYGLTYALTPAENYAWLSQMDLPAHIPTTIIFNSPQTSSLPGSVIAAAHGQRMLMYLPADVEDLFKSVFPQCEVIWSLLAKDTKTKGWSTWLLQIPPRQ